MNDLAQYKLELVIPSSTDLPVVTKLNLRNHEEKLFKNLHKIEKSLHKQLIFECNYPDVLHRVLPHQSSVKERLGDILYESYMNIVAEL